MATISDIAKKANVSRTLVSRVLNNKSGVSPENREKILSVIKEYNYVPNGLARALVLQKTFTIGVVMDDLCESFFFDLIRGMQAAGEALGYNILFCSAQHRLDIKMKYVDYFSQGRTDGIIAYGSSFTDETLFRSIAEKSKFVLIEGKVPNANVSKIQLDNFHGAYLATEHLIKNGYQHIIHVTGDMNYDASLERLNGFVQAMHDYKIPMTPGSIMYADYNEDAAYQQMKHLLDTGTKPDACFVGADKPAFGVMRAAMERGLTFPQDLAVIGFDDDEPYSRDIVFPGLTTMRQPLYDMGYAGVELLVDAINHPEKEKTTRTFQAELVIRDTCL